MSLLKCLALLLGSSVLAAEGAQVPLRPPHATTPLPDYVLKHAPLSYLHSREAWWPSDIATHLRHVVPKDGHTPIAASVTPANISALGGNVFLASMDDPFADPQAAWITGAGPPDAQGRSDAPATIVAVEKPGGVVDAFYMYFYSYNHMTYLDVTIGDHVGDWEHSMVRFVDGAPTVLYLSQHRSGVAYDFAAVPARRGRPLTYVAAGTHATYAAPGRHPHSVPGLHDETDAGALWDVTRNFRGYWFDNATRAFRAAGGAAEGDEVGADVRWLAFEGRWGDKQYRVYEKGQYCVFIPAVASACKLVDGPTGPVMKNLAREAPCQNEANCVIHSSV